MVAVPDFARITRLYGPAVVNVSVSGMRQVSAGSDDAENAGEDEDDNASDPMRLFLRRFQQQFGGTGATMQVPVRGQGSGFIVSREGLILTNAHVIADASEVTVKLTDRREYRAKILGTDRRTDIAVLKIEASDLPVVHIGNPDDLDVGEWVLAIGSPFGFDNSVTVGVVSAKGRTLPDGSAVPFIQSDAAVNPGQFGRAAVQRPRRGRRHQFADLQPHRRLPGTELRDPHRPGAKRAAPDREHGTRLPRNTGCRGAGGGPGIGRCVPAAPADGRARLRRAAGKPRRRGRPAPGDVIVQVDSKPIVASGELPAMFAMSQPGSRVELKVVRNGETLKLTATLGDSSKTAGREPAAPVAAKPAPGQLGLALRPLNVGEQRVIGSTAGLIVESASGAAQEAGVRSGDVILAINGKPANSLEQFREAVAGAGKAIALLLLRDGDKSFLPIRLP